MTTPGIILFAHGSRDPLWHLPIEAVASAIRERQPDVQVSCAYLELSSPDLMSAASKMIANGARHIRVFPLFLGVGKHAREDLPGLIAQLQALHPDIPVELLPAAGEHPQLTTLMADIALS
ncbi:MAG TPA: CbiX/SirB N-terminal domain-containing protein [Polaromonas sp.]|uniref:sirohydrochlorin chelatase n=1 Tax=Polaromonas sp. TaxID=1869339 RepID=UPI002D47CD89|nr:CbiX/SirB N-terminal domain-containing protein [Polaromonas sp.]HYW57250.1 CbiX/SirB N-terminal domain-containing protein [Polaromonas sp.]